jgi:hypothetical protein
MSRKTPENEAQRAKRELTKRVLESLTRLNENEDFATFLEWLIEEYIDQRDANDGLLAEALLRGQGICLGWKRILKMVEDPRYTLLQIRAREGRRLRGLNKHGAH